MTVVRTIDAWADTRSLGRCRSCGAAIEWVELVSGKRMPFNPPLTVVRTPPGLVTHGRPIVVVDLSTSHFATCPQAGQWSKRGRRA